MKKVKYIALVLVLCLGLMGGAYAAWTDSLAIETTAATGTLDHSWHMNNHFPNENNTGGNVHLSTVNGGWLSGPVEGKTLVLGNADGKYVPRSGG